MVDFANGLQGTRISGIIEGKLNSYEVGVTIEDCKVISEPGEERADIHLIVSPVTCFSNPELLVRRNIYHYWGDPEKQLLYLDDKIISTSVPEGLGLWLRQEDITFTCYSGSDAAVYNMINEFSNWIDNIQFRLDNKQLQLFSSDSLDAARYLNDYKNVDNILERLLINSTTDPLVRRYIEEYGEFPYGSFQEVMIRMYSLECDELKIGNRNVSLFEPITLEYPKGISVEDLEAIPDNATADFTPNGIEYLQKAVVRRFEWQDDIPLTIPVGNWYLDDFGYEYRVSCGDAVTVRLGDHIDPEYPFKYDIEVTVVKIPSNELDALAADSIGIDELANSVDPVQTLHDAIQSIINENYDDTRFRKNLRAAFRRRAKSEGITFGEE